MLDSPSKGFRPRPVNGPKYVTRVALCSVRVAELPLRAGFSPFPAVLFTGRGFLPTASTPGPRILSRAARMTPEGFRPRS